MDTKKADELGLVPLLGMSVSMLEATMERAGMPIIWEDGMTLDEKAAVAGLVWLQVAKGVAAGYKLAVAQETRGDHGYEE